MHELKRLAVILGGLAAGTASMFLPLGALVLFHVGTAHPNDWPFFLLMSLSVGAPGGMCIAAAWLDRNH